MADPLPDDDEADAGKGNPILRWLVNLVANATVLTALLVYFGWQSNDVQSRAQGFDETILQMSPRDYVLRSVRPVFVLVLVIAVCGILWLIGDAWLTRRLRVGEHDRVVRITLRLLPFAWLILPAVVWALGYAWPATSYVAFPATSYVAFPLSIGAGVLLVLYGIQLRGLLPGRVTLLRAFTAVIAGVMLFWGTTRYATVYGYEPADRFATHIHDLTQVVVYRSCSSPTTTPYAWSSSGTSDVRSPGPGFAGIWRSFRGAAGPRSLSRTPGPADADVHSRISQAEGTPWTIRATT